ncbi:MAG TPA: MBL fold metallo-hydrolase [Polyangia bacterium]|jgi:L-ascorbate metabolism protein UlaG (beta-lactamase superfamily)
MPSRAALAALALALASCGNFAATQPAPLTPRPAAPQGPAALTAYWIGHATVLVALKDRWIITDPNFSERVGVVTKRRVAPGIDLEALPKIDWALISHAHLDHLDHPSLARLGPVPVVAPPGVVPYLPKSPRPVVALAPWQSFERDGMRITAVPVRHGDGRYGVDELYHRNAHTGYVVEYAGLTVFFAGDTAYHPEYFKAIGRRFPRIDLALIPVGPTGRRVLRPLMKGMHADPAEALQILADTGARWMLPIHHSTFFREGAGELARIQAALRASPLGERVVLLRVGESLALEPRGPASQPVVRAAAASPAAASQPAAATR